MCSIVFSQEYPIHVAFLSPVGRLGWQGGHGGGGGEDQGGPAGEDGLSSGDSTPKRVRLVYVRLSFSAVNIYHYFKRNLLSNIKKTTPTSSSYVQVGGEGEKPGPAGSSSKLEGSPKNHGSCETRSCPSADRTKGGHP